MATAPSLTLLDGALNIDLSAMASGDMTLLAQYTSSNNYVFAYRQTGQFSVGSFLNSIPAVRRCLPRPLGSQGGISQELVACVQGGRAVSV